MATDTFFEESREQSAVKTAIVSKYFWSWAKVIMPQATKGREKKIAYLDLFAGPGRYTEGTRSTPLLILEKAIEDDQMRQMLVTIFNDVDTNNAQSLQAAIKALPAVEKLKFRPVVQNKEVGAEMVKAFSSMKLVPTLFFVGPLGDMKAFSPIGQFGA